MGVYQTVEKTFERLSRIMSYLASFFLTIMMGVIVVDVLFRYLLNSPIKGSIEIVEYLMIAVGSLGLAWCTLQRANITVGVMVDRFRKKVRDIMQVFAYLLSLLVFVLLSWRTVLDAFDRMLLYQDRTDVLNMPSYPFSFLLFFGFCCMCLAIVVRLVQTIKQKGN